MWEAIWSAVSSVVIVIVILLLAYFSTKYIGGVSRGRGISKNMKVIEMITLGQDKTLAIVKVGEKYLLVGVASGQINVMRELSEEELVFDEINQEGGQLPDFKSILNTTLKRSKGE